MSFQTIYDSTTATINALRSEMDVACRDGITAISKEMFAENLNVSSVYWTQTFDPAGTGFSLGDIMYTTVHVINGHLAQAAHHNTALGPSSLVEFATFLRSIAYHLFCAYGADATVTITPDAISFQKNA